MCVSEVAERFMLISGLSSQELSDWIFLCADACDYIAKRRIRSANNDEMTDRRLTNAAAVYAFYRYSVYAADEVKSFKAGDVQIETAQKLCTRAQQMWSNEVKSLRGLLAPEDDDNFCFFRM